MEKVKNGQASRPRKKAKKRPPAVPKSSKDTTESSIGTSTCDLCATFRKFNTTQRWAETHVRSRPTRHARLCSMHSRMAQL